MVLFQASLSPGSSLFTEFVKPGPQLVNKPLWQITIKVKIRQEIIMMNTINIQQLKPPFSKPKCLELLELPFKCH